MKELEVIQKTIFKLCQERYRNPGPFEEFTARLVELGVVRQTYDGVANTLFFYSENQLLMTLPISDIDHSMREPFTVNDTFNLEALKKAIDDIDTKITTATEFHKQIALAGIVYVSVHLVSNKIYYLSQDGQFYLEHY